MKQILVYHKLNDNTYYYKIVNLSFVRYKENTINSKNHELVLIIRDIKPKKRKDFKKRLINRLIRFLEKYSERS